jgi:N-terminal acetyltransferase B complex non-catalytic subunit
MASTKIRTMPNDRNGYLLVLSVATDEVSRFREDLSISPENESSRIILPDACQMYYHKFKRKVFCFDDLREPVSRLEEHERAAFLSAVEKDRLAESSDEKLLVLKFAFCFRSGNQESRQDLEQLADAALALYESCRKESKALPEAGFLAAVALVKIADLQDQSHSDGRSAHCELLLKAGMLLENFQKDQKHGEEYYPYLILLIRVQQLLGLMDMAMLNCKKVGVKNIQFESVGYLVLERISTLHPRQVGKITPNEDSGFSPLEQLDLGLQMLDTSEGTCTRQIDAGLGFGSYRNVIQAVQMRARLSRSINREIFAYEHLKTRRLTGILDEGGHPIPEHPLFDQRDFSFLQSYEISGETPLQHLQLGPLTKEAWLDTMSLYDKLFFYLRSEMAGQPGMSEKAMGLLETALQKIDDRSKEQLRLQLTDAEADNLAIHRALTNIVTQAKDSTTRKQTQTAKHLEELELWLEHKLDPQDGCVIVQGIIIPGWKFLHSSYTALETLQAISLFLSVANKKTSKLSKTLPLPKETLSKLQSLVSKAEAAIHQQAKDIKKGLNEAGVLGGLVDVIAGSGEETARQEVYCGEMKESWEDAVEGILACKVKIFK